MLLSAQSQLNVLVRENVVWLSPPRPTPPCFSGSFTGAFPQRGRDLKPRRNGLRGMPIYRFLTPADRPYFRCAFISPLRAAFTKRWIRLVNTLSNPTKPALSLSRSIASFSNSSYLKEPSSEDPLNFVLVIAMHKCLFLPRYRDILF